MTLPARNEFAGIPARTIRNLRFVEDEGQARDDVHRVTQRVLSLLGIAVFPLAQGIDTSLSERRLSDLQREGWPPWNVTCDSYQDRTETLGTLLWHVRNAAAHRRITFSSDSPDPSEVHQIVFEDRRKRHNKPKEEWRAWTSANDLLVFLEKFGHEITRPLGGDGTRGAM